MNVDRILDVIDVGLQQDARTDWAMGVGPEGWCVRCQRHDPVDGDLCSGCRAFLLEDSDEDPVLVRWNQPWGYVALDRAAALMDTGTDEIASWSIEIDGVTIPVEGYSSFEVHTEESGLTTRTTFVPVERGDTP